VNDRTVNIDNFAFEPAKRTVKVGTEVTWVNQDDTNHTVTEKDKAFESEELAENEEFSHRFTAAGVYNYYCKIHGKDRMSGEITVE
jgi:plastocyanin